MPSITCIDNLVNDITTTLCGYIPYYLDMYKNCIIDMHSDPRQYSDKKTLEEKSSVLLLRVSSTPQVEGLYKNLNIPLIHEGQSILSKVPNRRKNGIQPKRKTVHYHRILDYNPPEFELPQCLFQFDYVLLLNLSLHKEGNLFNMLPSSFVEWLEQHTVYVQAVDRVFKVDNLESNAYSGELRFIEDDVWTNNIQCSLSWPDDFEMIAAKSAIARTDSINRSNMSRHIYADRHKPKVKEEMMNVVKDEDVNEDENEDNDEIMDDDENEDNDEIMDDDDDEIISTRRFTSITSKGSWLKKKKTDRIKKMRRSTGRRIFKRKILKGLHKCKPRIFFDKDMRALISGKNHSLAIVNNNIGDLWERFSQFTQFVTYINSKHTLDNKTRLRARIKRLTSLLTPTRDDTYVFASTSRIDSNKSE